MQLQIHNFFSTSILVISVLFSNIGQLIAILFDTYFMKYIRNILNRFNVWTAIFGDNTVVSLSLEFNTS